MKNLLDCVVFLLVKEEHMLEKLLFVMVSSRKNIAKPYNNQDCSICFGLIQIHRNVDAELQEEKIEIENNIVSV
jgi:hypothetical protein